jgi:hypothetical protein
MIKSFKQKLMILLVIVITGCDPGLNYYQVVQNNTDHELTLLIQSERYTHLSIHNDTLNLDKDTVFYTLIKTRKIKPHSSDTVCSFCGIGWVKDAKTCNCRYSCNYHMQFVDTMPKVQKDITDLNNNWKKIIVEENRAGGGIVKCVFEINDADLSMQNK